MRQMNELSSENALWNEMNHRQEQNPLVSVIVPTYRRQDHLARALNSLVEQTYTPLEIVIVDDNGNIEWNKTVRSVLGQVFEGKNTIVKYICNPANLGSAETRNVGIRSATGEYITFLDDDDLYLPKKIEKQITHMLAEQSDFSITDLDLFNEKNKLVERRVRSYLHSYTADKLFKYHIMYHMTGTDTMMFKKCYLQKIGGFPPIDMGDEFYLMQVAIEDGGQFSYLPGCEVKAYVHSETEGISSGKRKISGENALYEFKKLYFDRLDPSEVKYIKMRHYAVKAFALLRMKKKVSFVAAAYVSFISAPFACIGLLTDVMRAKRGVM